MAAPEALGLDELTLASHATPQPAGGELLVEVYSAALNFSDLLMINNQEQVRPDGRSRPDPKIVWDRDGHGTDANVLLAIVWPRRCSSSRTASRSGGLIMMSDRSGV